MPRKPANTRKNTPSSNTPPVPSTQAVTYSLQEDMRKWWTEQSDAELQRIIPKINEYSSTDLMIVGATLVNLWKGDHQPPVETVLELALAFYALGKASRAFGAYQAGQMPTVETWEDAAIYIRMIQRVRSDGGWPGDPKMNRDKLIEDLRKWWNDTTEDEIARLLPKLDEYGTLDLIIMGNTLDTIWASKPDDSHAKSVEFTLSVYALSKLARAYGAYQNGNLPSDDTWLDASTYIRMILRTRRCGDWPGRLNSK